MKFGPGLLVGIGIGLLVWGAYAVGRERCTRLLHRAHTTTDTLLVATVGKCSPWVP